MSPRRLLITGLGVFIFMVTCLRVLVLAGTSCIQISVDVPKSLRQADLVFAGILLKNEAEIRLTFQGEKIWKGPSKGSHIVVYALGLPSLDSHHFKEGEKYLMFAKVLSLEERESHGVGPDERVAYGVARGCGSAPWPLALSKELDRLAKPRKPQRR